jgi:hypothetical protein
MATIIGFSLARAFPHADMRTDRVRAVLVAPTNALHQPIHDKLENGRVLDRIAELLAPFRLPREVVIKVAGCDGVDNAFYGDAEITVCYEYLQNVLDNARHAPPAGEPTPRDAIAGAMLDVIMHEMGHAVFDLLKIPVFGREEDAADQFSTFILLHLGREQTRALVLGVAYLGRREAREELSQNLPLRHYADEHGLPGQRYFNLLCAAYGFDRELFADAVSRWNLPADRAESCDDEYAQVKHAFETLIAPHIDQERLKQAELKRLPRFDFDMEL